MRINSFFFKIIRIHYSTFNFFKFFSHFISKSGFNTPQLAVADFERLKLLVAESEKFRGEYFVACCGDSEILGNFFIIILSILPKAEYFILLSIPCYLKI